MDKNCAVCGASQKNRPAIFRNEDYCCDLCRKVLTGEKSAEEVLEKKRNLQTRGS